MKSHSFLGCKGSDAVVRAPPLSSHQFDQGSNPGVDTV